jgi:nitrogen regulation protein NR(I)
MDKLLLIDDEADVQYSFQRIFASPEVELSTASSGEEGLRLLPKVKPDLVIMDIRMGGLSGLETLRRIRQIDSKLLVILMTAYGTTQTAIEAMKLGAYDYLVKPFDVPKLKEIVTNALKAARDMRESARYKFEKEGGRPLLEPEDFQAEIVGQSEAMHRVFKLIGQFAGTDTTVLITGESGTGKELVARAIYTHSKRAEGPFVAINCAAIPEQLLESELFGHERGAFTGAVDRRIGKFEQCKGGVIFLDEIGDMTAATQTKILRVLQSREFERVGGNTKISADVRVITATNKSLVQGVQAGRFREDLYYRLNGVAIEMPPLRDRRGDVPLLISYFLHKIAREQNSAHPPKSIASNAVRVLEKYHWPGNVRELESVLRRTVVVSQGDVVLLKDLPADLKADGAGAGPAASALAAADASGASDLSLIAKQLFQWARRDPKLKILPAIERELVILALKEADGNQVHASKLLGITRATLRKRIEKFGIQREMTIR